MLTEDQKEFLQKWITALRSGKYKQTKGCLRDGEGFCCLGVGCEIYDPNGWSGNNEGVYTYGRNMIFLPPDIRFLAGISDRQEVDLTALNDNDKSFMEIADYIEREILQASP
jgi:hypothetical protein